MDRRTFLAAAAVLTGKSPKPTSAADGGKPVRPTPLRASFSGPACYDDKELFELKRRSCKSGHRSAGTGRAASRR